jgi:hypothetical protein
MRAGLQGTMALVFMYTRPSARRKSPARGGIVVGEGGGGGAANGQGTGDGWLDSDKEVPIYRN